MTVFDMRDARRSVASHSKLALGYQRSLYDDSGPWKENDDPDGKAIVFTDKMNDLMKYNAEDCVAQSRCARAIRAEPEWNEPRVQKLYEVHTALAKIASRMHLRGFFMDEVNRFRLKRELLALATERAGALGKLINSSAWRGTPDQLRSIIYEMHRVPELPCFGLQAPDDPGMYTDPDQMTKCAVNKQALLHIITAPATPLPLKELIKVWWHSRAPAKALATYIESKRLAEAYGTDGCIHPQWNSCGTETMRWSCSGPNLMNLSEKQEANILRGDLPSVRAAYRARPGYELVHADYSQQELRIMEVVAQDDALWEALKTGDVYTFDAVQFFGVPWFDKDHMDVQQKSMRKGCKIIHLAKQYGAGEHTVHMQALQQDLTFEWQKTRRLARQWEKVYHRTVSYWEEEMKLVQETGYSQGCVLDGRLYYPAQPERSKVANYKVQRTAGEMTAVAMVKMQEIIDREKLDAHFITILHDAFDIEARCGRTSKRVQEIMKDVMPAPLTINGRTRTFPVDLKVDVNWSKV